MTEKEIIQIKQLCLELAIEVIGWRYTLYGGTAVEIAEAIVKASKVFENHFGIATAEDK